MLLPASSELKRWFSGKPRLDISEPHLNIGVIDATAQAIAFGYTSVIINSNQENKEMITRFITSAAAAAILITASVSTGQAAASDLDDCILDITFQCVDDGDFWGCYDVGVELCENQSSSEIANMSKSTLTTIKKNARQRAQTTLQKQINTKSR